MDYNTWIAFNMATTPTGTQQSMVAHRARRK